MVQIYARNFGINFRAILSKCGMINPREKFCDTTTEDTLHINGSIKHPI